MTIWWSNGKITRLQSEARAKLGIIGDLFTQRGKRALSEEGRGYAWGQFLDGARDDSQTGLYGTSAGIQALALTDSGAHSALIQSALATVNRDVETRYSQAGDTGVLYKLCHLIEATSAVHRYVTDMDPFAETLAKSALDNGGWAEYKSEGREAAKAKPLPTMTALLVLQKYPTFRNREECIHSLRRLCAMEDQRLYNTLYELSLSALTLYAYREMAGEVRGYQQALDSVGKRLTDAVIHRKPQYFGYPEVYHYTLNHKENRYIWFLSDCIAAFVLLRLGNPMRTRMWVLEVVKFFVEKTTPSGFASETTRRVSSLDQLWIARLLREFSDLNATELHPGLIANVYRLPYQWRVQGAFVCVSTIFIAAFFHYTELRIALSGIIIGIAINLLSQYVWRDKD